MTYFGGLAHNQPAILLALECDEYSICLNGAGNVDGLHGKQKQKVSSRRSSANRMDGGSHSPRPRSAQSDHSVL